MGRWRTCLIMGTRDFCNSLSTATCHVSPKVDGWVGGSERNALRVALKSAALGEGEGRFGG